MRQIPIYLLLCMIFPLFAEGASFDCKKSSGQVERLICSDAELSKLDDKMAQLYRLRLAGLANSEEQRIFSAKQREWLAGVRKNCRSARCLAANYKARIKILAATSAPEAVNDVTASRAMARLNEQLNKLKTLALSASNAKVSDFSSGGGTSTCQAMWRELQAAEVPKPDEIAVTGAEKRKLYEKVRRLAKSSRDRYLSVEPEKNTRKSEAAFKYMWPPSGHAGVFESDDSFPSAEMLFLPRSEASRLAGHIAYTADVLPDRSDSGVSLELAAIGRDGLTELRESAESIEYFDSRDHEPPFQLPPDDAGLLGGSGNVSLWKLRKQFKGGYWLLVAPVIDAKSGRSITCEVDFN